MSKCKICRKQINWWKPNEKAIPTDGPDEFNILPSRDGSIIGINSDGYMIRGEIVGDQNEDGYEICRLKHICEKRM